MVVGGGVAGLVSALLLQEAGCDVVVIEKLPELGGLARSTRYDGWTFDIGPHRFHTENPNVKAFLDRLIQGDGTFFPRVSEVFFKGKYYGWPIKPQNLVQLPPEIAAKASVDLVMNTFKEYEVDSFETYILRQYGPTLYEHFFKNYSLKFLGIDPAVTHPDWAKVGINRAIIDDNAQMQNLAQLLKSTLLNFDQKIVRYLYPTKGMYQAWDSLEDRFTALGGQVIKGSGAVMSGDNGRVHEVRAESGEAFEPSVVIWTAPITLAMSQLQLDVPHLPYLGLLLYNVCIERDIPRDYQWCYYGAKDLLVNRISVPKHFSEATAPPGCSGLCVEVTCMKDDARWNHAERLSDWVVDDLIRVGLIPSRRVVHDVYIERIPNSYPVYHKHYPEELEKARKSLGQFDNLHLAGRTGMFWYNNMDHSIENALQLTRRLLRDAGHAELTEMDLADGTSIGADARAATA